MEKRWVHLEGSFGWAVMLQLQNLRVAIAPPYSVRDRVIGGVLRYTVAELPLLEGTYYISVSSHNWEDTEMYDYHDRLYLFRVVRLTGERYGILTLWGKWS